MLKLTHIDFSDCTHTWIYMYIVYLYTWHYRCPVHHEVRINSKFSFVEPAINFLKLSEIVIMNVILLSDMCTYIYILCLFVYGHWIVGVFFIFLLFVCFTVHKIKKYWLKFCVLEWLNIQINKTYKRAMSKNFPLQTFQALYANVCYLIYTQQRACLFVCLF